MNFFFHYPSTPLSAFVERFWLYEGYYPAHAKERVMPTGTAELVINLHADQFRIYDPQNPTSFKSFRGSLAVGPHSEYFVIDTDSQAAIIGLQFKPGGAFPFFKVAAHELRDRHISLDDLWGNAAAELRDRLLEAPTPAAKFQTFEKVLLRQLVRPLELRPAVRLALGEFQTRPNAKTIADLAVESGFSPKRFNQIFSEEVGLTPKLFWRVKRFQAALGQVYHGREVNWSDLSLSCGYFDQAHFNHDFQAFSGLNPATYLIHRSNHQNHVRLPD